MGLNEPQRFERRFPQELVDALKRERLFTDKLRPDIEEADDPCRRVFPAIRRNRIDFYHQGGKLFTYDATGFRTNLKYAMGFESGEAIATEVKEDDLQHLRRIRTFLGGYESIKALCSLFGGLEAKKVADLFGQFSFAVRSAIPSPVVVLDIEASFDARVREDADNSQDRIDLILLRVSDGAILCVEAKLFENSAIRAAEGKVPEVVAQVERYRQQVERQGIEIRDAYRDYVLAMNQLFGLTLPPPAKVIGVDHHAMQEVQKVARFKLRRGNLSHPQCLAWVKKELDETGVTWNEWVWMLRHDARDVEVKERVDHLVKVICSVR